MKNKGQLLIDILLDKTARIDEREDAAIDIGQHPNLSTLNGLIKIASDPSEDVVVLEHCAESIGEICVALKILDEVSFIKLLPSVKEIVLGYISFHGPGIINQKLRDELSQEGKDSSTSS